MGIEGLAWRRRLPGPRAFSGIRRNNKACKIWLSAQLIRIFGQLTYLLFSRYDDEAPSMDNGTGHGAGELRQLL